MLFQIVNLHALPHAGGGMRTDTSLFYRTQEFLVGFHSLILVVEFIWKALFKNKSLS